MYRAMDFNSTPKDPDSKWQNVLLHRRDEPYGPRAEAP